MQHDPILNMSGNGGFSVEPVGMLQGLKASEISDSTIGVNVFESITSRDLDLLAASGAKWAKVQFICDLEGQPSFGWNYYDFLVSGLADRGLHVAAQFLRWNLVGNTPGPFESLAFPPPTREDSAMRSWLDFVRESVSRYSKYIRHWEVWNEEDIETFWPPVPDVQEYAELLIRTSETIREAAAESEIILGGLCDYDYEASWIVELNRLGALQAIDIIGIHPERTLPELGLVTRMGNRETRVSYPEMMNQFRAAMGSEASRLRLWDTEVQHTYTTHLHAVKEPHKRAPLVRAKHLLRRFLMEAHLGIEQTFWQHLKAYPYEDHPGQLIDLSGKPTRAYAALCHICSVMGERQEQADILIKPVCIDRQQHRSEPDVTPRYEVITCSFCRPDGALLITYWSGAEPSLDATIEALDITVGVIFHDPVVVDMLAGKVYRPTRAQASDGDTVFRLLPLYDSPIAIAERTALQIGW